MTGRKARNALKVLSYVLLLVASLSMLLPIFLMIVTAIKAPGESQLNPGFIPRQIVFSNFVDVFEQVNVPLLARSSIIITTSTVIILLLLGSMAAYAFARIEFAFREVFYFLFLAGLMIPSAAVIVPLYQLNVAYGLLDTYMAVVGPYVGLGLPFTILLLRGFFQSLPKELEDAARIDGASRFGIYWRILLPLTRPALVTVAVFQGLWAWNDFLLPMLFLTKPYLHTLPLGLIRFKTIYNVQHEHRFALIVMMTMPVFILFLLAQRQFIAGERNRKLISEFRYYRQELRIGGFQWT